MDLSELDSCNICTESYDEKCRRPHVLPCGHTICSCCVTNGIEGGMLKCPLCQRTHRAYSVDDVPINYSTEYIISKLREKQQGAIPKSTNLSSRARSLKNRALEVVSDQKDSFKTLVKITEKLCSDIKEYRNFVQERKTKHQDLSAEILELLHQNEEVTKELELEDKNLEKVLEEGEEHQREANSHLLKLTDLTQIPSLEETSEQLEKMFHSMTNWNEKFTAQLPSVKIISSSDKIISVIFSALQVEAVLQAEILSHTVPAVKLDEKLSVMEKVHKIAKGHQLSVESLQKMPQKVKTLFKTGNVYAIQSRNGSNRYARVTLRDNKKYLHYLKDEKPPGYAYTFKHSDLIEALNTDCTVAFIDLKRGNSIRGRVHIDLSPDTPLARHFWTLCTGTLGPSYAKSKFLKVVSKGHQVNEYVEGGDYENYEGSGGASLFTRLNSDERIYQRKLLVGTLQSAYVTHDGTRSAQFRIYTGKKEGGINIGIFGRVKDGLNIVRETVKLDDIEKVTIADCGVVLSF